MASINDSINIINFPSFYIKYYFNNNQIYLLIPNNDSNSKYSLNPYYILDPTHDTSDLNSCLDTCNKLNDCTGNNVVVNKNNVMCQNNYRPFDFLANIQQPNVNFSNNYIAYKVQPTDNIQFMISVFSIIIGINNFKFLADPNDLMLNMLIDYQSYASTENTIQSNKSLLYLTQVVNNIQQNTTTISINLLTIYKKILVQNMIISQYVDDASSEIIKADNALPLINTIEQYVQYITTDVYSYVRQVTKAEQIVQTAVTTIKKIKKNSEDIANMSQQNTCDYKNEQLSTSEQKIQNDIINVKQTNMYYVEQISQMETQIMQILNSVVPSVLKIMEVLLVKLTEKNTTPLAEKNTTPLVKKNTTSLVKKNTTPLVKKNTTQLAKKTQHN